MASAPLDDFLAGAGASSSVGERVETIGLAGSLTGIVLAVVLVVFLAVVHRGTREEVRALLRVVAFAGLVTVVGAAVEVAGLASVFETSWADALTSSGGSAPMMRLLGGLLVLFGIFENTGLADVDSDLAGDEGLRWYPGSASAFGIGGLLLTVLSFAFDGHAVTTGPRVLHALADAAHVTAGGVWVGGIVGLVAVAMIRRRTGGHESIGVMVVRFAVIATLALVVVASTGVAMAAMILDRPGDLVDTEWGKLLLVKTSGVAAATAVGAYNHFVVVPALRNEPESAAVVRRARTAITIEAIVFAAVLVVTVWLTRASTS